MRQESILAALLIGTLAVSVIGAAAADKSGATPSMVTVYPAPEGAPVSSNYVLTVEGRTVPVYGVPTRNACFASCDIAGPVTVTVTVNVLPAQKITAVSAHPLSRGIAVQRDGNVCTFRVDRPGSVTLLINGEYGGCPLYIFFNPPAEAPPKDAIVFAPGKHVLGYDKPITLTNGQSVYLAGGAWVEGIIRATDARNIRILGRGVLCQSVVQGKDYTGAPSAPPGICLVNCQDVTLEGIIETRSVIGWCSLVMNCERMTVRGYNVITPMGWSTDGFNPCNSRDITIERCFFRTGDDCISIKGNMGPDLFKEPHAPPAGQPPVENIVVSNCVFWGEGNNVTAIGSETRARYMRNIRFQDCDVLYHKRDSEAVFAIIPLHGTEIRDIVYDDIRIEQCIGQLFNFRFLDSIFGIPGDQSYPGAISNVTIRKISVGHQENGPRSTFFGYSEAKQIQHVTIQDLRYGGKPIRNPKEGGFALNKYTPVENIRFITAAAPAKQTPEITRAQAAGGNRVDLAWTPVAPADADDTIHFYAVYRDGVQIDRTTAPAFNDNSVREKTTYTYRIAAMNGSWQEGTKSAPAKVVTPADTTPPAIVSVSAQPGLLVVTFSEPVERAGAETHANYALDNGATVKRATLRPDHQAVTLAVENLAMNGKYTLTINRVRDVAAQPNVMAPDSRKAFTATFGMVGQWLLNEGAGTTATDSSGAINHGQIKGEAKWVSGPEGRRLKLEPDSYVEIPNSPSMEKVQEGSYTLCVWFTPLSVPPGTADSANDAAYGIMIKAGFHLGLNYNHGRKYAMIHWLQGNQAVVASSASAFEPGKRCHVAGVVDRVAGVVRLYVNGKLEGESPFAANAPARPFEPTPWRLGIAKPAAQDFRWPAHGILGSAQIYKVALSSNEVSSLAEAGGR